jgi:hypothetical protein
VISEEGEVEKEEEEKKKVRDIKQSRTHFSEH